MASAWTRVEAVRGGLSGADVTKGGNRRERAAEKEKVKEREPANDGPSGSERGMAAVGGRTTHAREADQLQPEFRNLP